ncbi:14031_t:CDS:2 [Acaulospora colombiana]|uniref:14031_t:CDS:1 n=1 Tax=Acaulospora colombiana TaxID=27376 RepID=A0ACA9KUZ0_9GLOM|nr:14031_t:CDS:2 [Acaulospora colombiana]
MVLRMFASTPPTLSPSRWNHNNLFERRGICFPPPRTRDVAIYLSGVLFAIGWWTFVDAVVYAIIRGNTLSDTINVIDWISGIITTIGMLIVGSIDKTLITDEFAIYSISNEIRWKARLLLFLGFTLLVGGTFCSMSVFILKYMLRDVEMEKLYFGVAVLVQNVCVMMSSFVLLIGQRAPNTKYDILL